MAILSGKQIRARLEETSLEKRLVITPFFDADLQIDAGAASIDLRLGCRFSATKRGRVSHLDIEEPSHPRELVDEYYVPLGRQFVLHPRHFVLATTLEWVRVPPTLAGYILSRSSYGRRGLIIATATGVHANYSGVLTLELTNVAEVPLAIVPGQPICQFFIHDVSDWDPQEVDKSKFLGSLFPRLGSASPDCVTEFLTKAGSGGAREDQ